MAGVVHLSSRQQVIITSREIIITIECTEVGLVHVVFISQVSIDNTSLVAQSESYSILGLSVIEVSACTVE